MPGSEVTSTGLVQTPLPAVAGEKKDKSVLDRLDELEKTIKDRFKSLHTAIDAAKEEFGSSLKNVKDDAAKQVRDLNGLAERLKNLETDVALWRTRESVPAKSALDKASLDEIKSAIDQALAKLQPATSRTSMSPPVAAPSLS